MGQTISLIKKKNYNSQFLKTLSFPSHCEVAVAFFVTFWTKGFFPDTSSSVVGYWSSARLTWAQARCWRPDATSMEICRMSKAVNPLAIDTVFVYVWSIHFSILIDRKNSSRSPRGINSKTIVGVSETKKMDIKTRMNERNTINIVSDWGDCLSFHQLQYGAVRKRWLLCSPVVHLEQSKLIPHSHLFRQPQCSVNIDTTCHHEAFYQL